MDNYTPRQCEHIRDTGLRCPSPAMRGRDFCYYHLRLHTNVLPGDSDYVLPALETEQSIQLAATHIVRAMLKGKIDRRDAMTMFAGIRLAQSSIRAAQAPSESDIDNMELELTPAMERVCSADAGVRGSEGPSTPSVTMATLIDEEEAKKGVTIGAGSAPAVWEQVPSPAPSIVAANGNRDREARGVSPAATKLSGNSRQRRAAMRRAERLIQQTSKQPMSA